MTIPTLVTNIQKKQTVTKLQKAISVINQAYRMSYDEVGEATPEEAVEMGADAYFEKYWKPYIKTVHICINNVDCGYSNNNPFYFKNGAKGATSVTNPATRTTFYTPEGYVYIIFVAYANTTSAFQRILVDINGSKAPNKLGYDVFVLQRVVDPIKGGYVYPCGYEKSTADINQLCSGPSSGEDSTCAEKIRRDG